MDTTVEEELTPRLEQRKRATVTVIHTENETHIDLYLTTKQLKRILIAIVTAILLIMGVRYSDIITWIE